MYSVGPLFFFGGVYIKHDHSRHIIAINMVAIDLGVVTDTVAPAVTQTVGATAESPLYIWSDEFPANTASDVRIMDVSAGTTDELTVDQWVASGGRWVVTVPITPVTAKGVYVRNLTAIDAADNSTTVVQHVHIGGPRPLLDLSAVDVPNGRLTSELVAGQLMERPKSAITTVVLPATCTILGDECFQGYANLANVVATSLDAVPVDPVGLVLPPTFTELGARAFKDCVQLAGTVPLPITLDTIGDDALAGTGDLLVVTHMSHSASYGIDVDRWIHPIMHELLQTVTTSVDDSNVVTGTAVNDDHVVLVPESRARMQAIVEAAPTAAAGRRRVAQVLQSVYLAQGVTRFELTSQSLGIAPRIDVRTRETTVLYLESSPVVPYSGDDGIYTPLTDVGDKLTLQFEEIGCPDLVVTHTAADEYQLSASSPGNLIKFRPRHLATKEPVTSTTVLHPGDRIGFYHPDRGEVCDLVIGSVYSSGTVVELSELSSTAGDPHVYPLIGRAYELDPQPCALRMLQTSRPSASASELVVNASTRFLTADEVDDVHRFYARATGTLPPHTLVAEDGICYDAVFVQVDGMAVDFRFHRGGQHTWTVLPGDPGRSRRRRAGVEPPLRVQSIAPGGLSSGSGRDTVRATTKIDICRRVPVAGSDGAVVYERLALLLHTYDNPQMIHGIDLVREGHTAPTAEQLGLQGMLVRRPSRQSDCRVRSVRHTGRCAGLDRPVTRVVDAPRLRTVQAVIGRQRGVRAITATR